jgi:hypothetical protein
MVDGQVYVLGGIRWGFTSTGHTQLSGEHELLTALERIKQPNEIVFPSLSYAYHSDLRLNERVPPTIPSVTFVNLSLPASDIAYEIDSVRRRLPCTIFVLYASDDDFQRCMRELPRSLVEGFQHYLLLRKPNTLATMPEGFDGTLRTVLNKAVDATLARARSYPRFSSAFISYSHQDKDFARWLETNLTTFGVHCWLDEKKLRPGDRMLSKVEEGIREHEKVLLCASRHSLNSWWVDNEVGSVLAKEQALWKMVGGETLALIPLNLDGYLFSDEWSRGWKNQVVSRLAADFTGWEKRVQLDAAVTGETRAEILLRLGGAVLSRQNEALQKLRAALLRDE